MKNKWEKEQIRPNERKTSKQKAGVREIIYNVASRNTTGWGSSAVKNLPVRAGDGGSIPAGEGSLEKGPATHSRIPA